MISRRDFLATSVIASAASLAGCRQNADGAAGGQPAAVAPGRTRLELSFVGGTAFVRDGRYMSAMQLSGYGQHHNGHSLEHNSFLVGPTKLFPSGTPLPTLTATRLGDSIGKLAAGVPLSAICLVGKDIKVSGSNAADFDFKCQHVARYGHVAAAWRPKGSWAPGSKQPVNSRFSLQNGVLTDGVALNTNGAAVQWWVKDPGKAQTLSDVATLELEADNITVSNLLPGDFVVPPGTAVPLMVFSGPLVLHQSTYKYRTLTHALLLKTIFDVGTTTDAEIMPTTAIDIDGMPGDSLPNPCGDVQRAAIPPDSEYCANYDEFP